MVIPEKMNRYVLEQQVTVSCFMSLFILVIAWYRVQVTINCQVITKKTKFSESIGRGQI